jgi:hypothetical protein
MDSNKLSELYFLATSFVQSITTELYESMHTNSGEPITDQEIIKSKVDAYVKNVRAEVDLIRRAVQEFNE